MPAIPPKPPKPPPNSMPMRPAPTSPPIMPDRNGLRAKKPPGAAAGVAAGRACACWVGVAERSTGLAAGAVWVGAGAWSVLLPRLPLLVPPPTRASAMAGTRRTIAAIAASKRLVLIFNHPCCRSLTAPAMCDACPPGSRSLLLTLCEFGEVSRTGLREKLWRWGGNRTGSWPERRRKRVRASVGPPSPRPPRQKGGGQDARRKEGRQEEGRRAETGRQACAQERRPSLAAPPGEGPPLREAHAEPPARAAQDAAAGRRHLRARPREERRQLRAADAAAVPRAQRQRLSRAAGAGARTAAADLGRHLRTLPAARLGARQDRHRRRRHGRDHGAQHPRDVRGAFRRADDRRAC